MEREQRRRGLIEEGIFFMARPLRRCFMLRLSVWERQENLDVLEERLASLFDSAKLNDSLKYYVKNRTHHAVCKLDEVRPELKERVVVELVFDVISYVMHHGTGGK